MEWLGNSALLGQAQLILTELVHVCDQLWVQMSNSARITWFPDMFGRASWLLTV